MAITQDDKLAKLASLEKTFKAYIKERRARLEIERQFLESIAARQGITATGRRNANYNKIRSLAAVKDLIPTANI